MCELFGLSASRAIALQAPLEAFRLRGGHSADNPDGWGIAYRNGDTFAVSKEPLAAARSPLLAQLALTLRSDLVIAHVRKANPPTPAVPANTHPFVRECCGRQWVFAHNGKVPEVVEPQGCCHPQRSRPLGETDSEHAFYFLLDEIAAVFGSVLGSAPPDWLGRLAALSADVAAYGQFNFLMSDGEHLIAYGHDRLHWLPHVTRGYRSVMLASAPLTADRRWAPVAPGTLLVYRNGEQLAELRAPAAALASIPAARTPSDAERAGATHARCSAGQDAATACAPRLG